MIFVIIFSNKENRIMWFLDIFLNFLFESFLVCLKPTSWSKQWFTMSYNELCSNLFFWLIKKMEFVLTFELLLHSLEM